MLLYVVYLFGGCDRHLHRSGRKNDPKHPMNTPNLRHPVFFCPPFPEQTWIYTHMLHVWNIYQHLPNKYTIHGTSGYWISSRFTSFFRFLRRWTTEKDRPLGSTSKHIEASGRQLPRPMARAARGRSSNFELENQRLDLVHVAATSHSHIIFSKSRSLR